MSINKFNSEGYYEPTCYEALSKVEREEKQTAYQPLVYVCSPFYMKNSRISVAEVGRSVGYDNQLHFSRAFKSVFGVPPSEYRNLHYFHTEK